SQAEMPGCWTLFFGSTVCRCTKALGKCCLGGRTLSLVIFESPLRARASAVPEAADAAVALTGRSNTGGPVAPRWRLRLLYGSVNESDARQPGRIGLEEHASVVRARRRTASAAALRSRSARPRRPSFRG